MDRLIGFPGYHMVIDLNACWFIMIIWLDILLVAVVIQMDAW